MLNPLLTSVTLSPSPPPFQSGTLLFLVESVSMSTRNKENEKKTEWQHKCILTASTVGPLMRGISMTNESFARVLANHTALKFAISCDVYIQLVATRIPPGDAWMHSRRNVYLKSWDQQPASETHGTKLSSNSP